MTIFGLPLPVLRAVTRREAVTTRHNRFIQIFAVVVLAGSAVIAALSTRPESVAYGLLLLYLYVVPLFGLLAGASAAQEDRSERPFLLSQPAPRTAFVLGKAAILITALAGVLALTLLPALAAGTGPSAAALLGFLGIVLALVSITSGLAIGYCAGTQARGLMFALLGWFTAFGLYDVLALGLSGFGAVQQTPLLWVAFLLLNPLDAVRLAGLFGLEQVPFSIVGTTDWINPLLTWLPGWVAVLATAWTAGMLVLACRRTRYLDS